MKKQMVSVDHVVRELNRIAGGIETDRFTLENIRAFQVSLQPQPHPDAECEEITIHVFRDSAGDFQYGIYKGSPEDAVDADSIDGGACRTTIQNALDMAVDQAKNLV